MIRTLVLLGAVEVVLPLVLWLMRDRVVFLPSARPPPEEGLGALRDVNGRLVRVARPDGRALAAYDATPAGFDSRAGPVVLFLHGNAGNIALRAELLAWFAEGAGARVLLPDYTGYGGNAGSPSEREVEIDALAAFDHLVAGGVDPARIVVFGESVGCAPALCVATERRVAGVVLQSGFSSLSSAALRLYPWLPLTSLLARGSYPNDERAARLTVPVLVVHGTRDRVMPIEEGRKLHAAASGSEFLAVEGADHNDLFEVAGEEHLRGLGERFRRWVASGARPDAPR